jgi:pyrroline-5-carboxylate reductase
LKRLSIIGVGNMGYALVRGFVQSGIVIAENICVFDVDRSKTQTVAREFGVRAATDVATAFSAGTDIAILAVKPQIMQEVLVSVADSVHENLILISIAAGISADFILSHLKRPVRLIRAMPNAAAMIFSGATALCKAGLAEDKDLTAAVELFGAVGLAVPVEEKMMNVVTALSGSGAGYLFPIMEALADGAVQMGLDRPTARALTVQTVLGAATMAASQNASFSDLKDRITSPGGTTIAGLSVMERAGLRGILMATIQAATLRAEELQKGK